jgi:hypothetical protein
MNRKLVYYWSIVAFRSIAAYLADMSEQDIMPSQHPEFGQVLNHRNTIWEVSVLVSVLRPDVGLKAP